MIHTRGYVDCFLPCAPQTHLAQFWSEVLGFGLIQLHLPLIVILLWKSCMMSMIHSAMTCLFAPSIHCRLHIV